MNWSWGTSTSRPSWRSWTSTRQASPSDCRDCLVGTLYEERSRKGIGSFGLTERIQGYWDRNDTEIDLVAVAGEERVLRVVTCKRSSEKLVSDLPRFDGHVMRFLTASPKFGDWKVQKLAVAPVLDSEARRAIEERGYVPEDLADLTQGLRSAAVAPGDAKHGM